MRALVLALSAILCAASPVQAALSYAHGAVQWQTADVATTVYTVSGLGFQPKAFRFYWMGLGSAADTVSTGTSRRGIGFASGTGDQRCVGTQDKFTADPTNTSTGYRADCIAMTIEAGTVDGRLRLDSVTADGFTLEVDDASPANLTVFYEVWGGTDITVAATLEITEPAATGNQDYTVTGFSATDSDDQIVMFAGVQATGAAPTAARNDAGFMVGFASGGATAENAVVAVNADDNNTTSVTHRYGLDGECIAMIVVAGGNPNARATMTQFNANGFRLNWIARAVTSRKYIALAIKGGRWMVGSFVMNSTTIGNTTVVSGLSFAPIGISLISHYGGESTAGTAVTEDALTIGSGSSTSSRRFMANWVQHAAATSDINLAMQYDQVSGLPNSSSSALDSAHDIDAMNSDGFRIIVDVAVAGTQWHGYMTFASAAVAATGRPSDLLLLGVGR